MQECHSDETYRRLYRLMKKGVEPRRIAATLNLPIKTVQNIISRLQDKHADWDILHESQLLQPQHFLDIYIFTKTRHAILQPVGMIVEQTTDILNCEFAKIETMNWKAVAIKISDVSRIDQAGGKALIDFHNRMSALHRYVALLDPSPELEPTLQTLKIEDIIPVFGTENAFEEHAFCSRSNWKIKS